MVNAWSLLYDELYGDDEMSENKNDWGDAISKPRFHVNQDGSVRAEPESFQDNKNVTFTNSNDMYFGGVCVTGINDDVIAYGDKRRGDISWTN